MFILHTVICLGATFTKYSYLLSLIIPNYQVPRESIRCKHFHRKSNIWIINILNFTRSTCQVTKRFLHFPTVEFIVIKFWRYRYSTIGPTRLLHFNGINSHRHCKCHQMKIFFFKVLRSLISSLYNAFFVRRFISAFCLLSNLSALIKTNFDEFKDCRICLLF